MLRRLTIANIKGFGETPQTLVVRPLTLLFGPNSAGKSTLLQSLALLHGALTLGHADIARPEIASGAVDLGGFEQFVHRGDRKREVAIGVEFDAHPYFAASNILPLVDGERSPDTLKQFATIGVLIRIGLNVGKRGRAEPITNGFDLTVDGSTVATFRRVGRTLRSEHIHWSHPLIALLMKRGFQDVEHTGVRPFDRTTDSVEDPPLLRTALVSELLPKYRHLASYFLPAGIRVVKPKNPGLSYALAQVLRNPLDRLLRSVNQGLKKELGGFLYIGPVRVIPARATRVEQRTGSSAESRAAGDPWEALAERKDVLARINEWLSAKDRLRTPYELRISKVYSEESLAEFAQMTGPRLSPKALVGRLRRVGRPLGHEIRLLDKLTGTAVSHRDVGVGISQVLPVLVAAYAHRGQIIAIEQPELHLHPALQAELADVLAESATGQGNTLLLETHSEHLILRLLRRIREANETSIPFDGYRLRPEDVTVAYVMPGPGGATITELLITPDGDFDRPWPEGFFTERLKELM